MTGKKFWAMIMVGLLLFGITRMAFGTDIQTPPTVGGAWGAPGALPVGLAIMDEEFGKALDELIAVNVITAEQKGRIIKYFGKALKDAMPMDPKVMAELQSNH